MPADASVRRAREGDVPMIAAVQARAWQRAYADLLSAEVAEQLVPERFVDAWRSEVAASLVFVATSADVVVGAVAVRTAPPVGEIATLVVDPAEQRRGHGSRMLSALTDTLRDGGASEVRAWTPTVDNARLRFLTSAGLEPDGAQRVLVNADGGEVIEIRLRAVLEGDGQG
jgi:N-acetylglutamate synthase-like GNAT family acetyltransferase